MVLREQSRPDERMADVASRTDLKRGLRVGREAVRMPTWNSMLWYVLSLLNIWRKRIELEY